MVTKSYSEKLRMPQWQKRRLYLLEHAKWRCAICGAEDRELHVHHLEYNAGKEPWDYPDTNFLVVCQPCHEKRIHKDDALYRDLPDVRKYTITRFEHMDDFRCFQSLAVFCEGQSPFEKPSEHFVGLLVGELRQRLIEFFKKNGWEGDGEINCIIVPPCFIPEGYSWCETVFHVKQRNNGTSFLALPPGFRLSLARDMWA